MLVLLEAFRCPESFKETITTNIQASFEAGNSETPSMSQSVINFKKLDVELNSELITHEIKEELLRYVHFAKTKHQAYYATALAMTILENIRSTHKHTPEKTLQKFLKQYCNLLSSKGNYKQRGSS